MPLPRTAFGLQLAAFAAVGVVLRLLYIALTPADAGSGDVFFYHEVANLLADGKGYVNPLIPDVPTAQHPPLYTYALAALSVIGMDTPQAHRLLGVVTGTVVVVLAGLLGRRVAGERAGVAVAGLAALSPTLIRADTNLLSETVYGPLVVGALLLAYRLLDEPSRRTAAALGALIGLAALARQEALLLLPLLVLPLAWRARTDRVAIGAVACGVAILVITPWLVRNWTTFDTTPRLSSNGDAVIAYANCDRTYATGEELGGWIVECWPPIEDLNDMTREGAQRARGMEYALDHVDRWPAVVTARVLRTWSLRSTGSQGDGYIPGSLFVRDTGHLLFLVLAVFAIAGGVLLRRRGAPLLILLAPVVLVTIASAVGWGAPRFRYAAEVPVLVLATVGLLALADRLRGTRRPAG